MSFSAINFHAVGAGALLFLILLLFVGAIVGLFALMLNWRGFSREHQRVTNRWMLTVGLCGIMIASWGEFLSGSTSLTSTVVSLSVTVSFVHALRHHPKPSAWEPTSATVVTPSHWELASARYRRGAIALSALSLSAGVAMLARLAFAVL